MQAYREQVGYMHDHYYMDPIPTPVWNQPMGPNGGIEVLNPNVPPPVSVVPPAPIPVPAAVNPGLNGPAGNAVPNNGNPGFPLVFPFPGMNLPNGNGNRPPQSGTVPPVAGPAPPPPIVPSPNSASSGLAKETIIIICILCALLAMILGTIIAFIYMNKNKKLTKSLDEAEVSNNYQGGFNTSSKMMDASGKTVISPLPSVPGSHTIEMHDTFDRNLGTVGLTGAALAGGYHQENAPQVPEVPSTPLDSGDVLFENAAEHQHLHDTTVTSTIVPVTNISDASSTKLLDDPFYEVQSEDENVIVGEDQLYALPPMSRQVERNGVLVTENVDPATVLPIIQKQALVEPSTIIDASELTTLTNVDKDLPNINDYDTAILVTETTTVIHNSGSLTGQEAVRGVFFLLTFHITETREYRQDQT